MATWIKPNKVELELNEEKATIEKAESLGWKLKEEKKPVRKPASK